MRPTTQLSFLIAVCVVAAGQCSPAQGWIAYAAEGSVSRAVHHDKLEARSPKGDELRSALGAAGLEAPVAVRQALRKLGLSDLVELRLLDTAERLEMMAALQSVALLGDRAKTRRLIDAVEVQSTHNGPSVHRTALETAQCSRESQLRKRVQEEEMQRSSGGTSVETGALILTALLGLLSYVVQAKLARDTVKSEKLQGDGPNRVQIVSPLCSSWH